MNAMSGIERWNGLSALMILFAQEPWPLAKAGIGTRLWRSICRSLEITLPPLAEQRRIVAELDAEAAQMEAVRSLLPRFEAKIQRVLDRVWGSV
jgi:hypothetical protein